MISKEVVMLKTVLCFLMLLFTNVSLFADTPTSLGEMLERHMWANIKEGNWSVVENHIAPDFQAAHFKGTRNREQEIAVLKGLKIKDFTIKDMKVTTDTDSIVLTYTLVADETIDGVRVASDNLRLTVWHKRNDIWQWIVHTNLTPVPNKYQ
jgi:hypothetical protein